MIEAAHITCRRGAREILSDVSLSVQPGRLTVVLGPNGAGKSTLLACLTADLPVSAGRITLDGRPLAAWRKSELALRRAVLPQKSHLAFPFTVREVVELGLIAAGGHSLAGGGRDRHRQQEEAVRVALSRVGLLSYAGRYYQQLSGGEQQRVHIARICCQLEVSRRLGAAPYLFLDEPISNLDLRHQLETLDIVRDFVAQGGGAFAILHDINLASLYADELVILSNGRVAARGTPAETLTTEVIAQVFDVPVTLNQVPSGGKPFLLPHTAR
ncbi:heme ABC transporter ATP-binding protein [Rhodoligotrophos defluvii]|uniref:heme ABC transporter ATP-binding protein n=1 Tax=Rhodoligotrophos defluvii TaxID=2561934 RepID=UPI0010C98442|nr:heme ABC transporter ATP-binding protein [Rhodoligotrophos defluvii]